MGIKKSVKNQFRSVVQWDDPKKWQIFHRFMMRGDELKNASSLVLQPGQGCILTYEGKIKDVIDEEGLYNLETDNRPFITTLSKYKNAFESEHKVGLWFFRQADIVNIRWGTSIPIAYIDPIYNFPILLRGHGNYSIRITDPKKFFTNVVAGQEEYFANELQELFLSRITQPIYNYLANAKFSYAEIDANVENIAKDARDKTVDIFEELGFELLDFRIEGTTFDPETLERINEIANVQADAKAAELVGVSFTELQHLKSMRDMAKNEGQAGGAMGMMAGMNMGGMMTPNTNTGGGHNGAGGSSGAPSNGGGTIKEKLAELKELLDDDLISQEDFDAKKQALLAEL